jgi:hypothetical protein
MTTIERSLIGPSSFVLWALMLLVVLVVPLLTVLNA